MAAGRRMLALVAGMAVLLVACADGGRNSAAGPFRPATPGVLTVATAEVPLAGFWEGTAPRPEGGFEQGLAAALAARFGLGRTEVVVVPFPELVAGRFGSADLALSQITPTAEREKVLAFSVPYLRATPGLLTRTGTEVTDLAAAREQRVAVQRESTLEPFLTDVIRPDRPPLIVDDESVGIDALTAGRVDAVLLEVPVAAAIASRSGGRLQLAAQFAGDDSFAVALPRSSSNAEAVDSAVRAFTKDGTIRDLAGRWLDVALSGISAEDVPLSRTRRP